ncbi:hypothetical protein [Kitasatospora fiedleri]|uniref:hypothetical protein n=1 Tax=Kitasatospora fiedleri TaxID=2991545 RepID=UPI00249B8D1B|nr:hypothetical protein [Kitasatospora fiedleri]
MATATATATADQPARRPGRLTAALHALLHPTDPAAPDQEPWPEDLLVRYLTLGGAHVDLTRDPAGHTWTCHGCGTRNRRRTHPFTDPYSSSDRRGATEDANFHATECRSTPRPAAR